MSEKPKNFTEVVVFLAGILKGYQYAFRGTTSLVLQGLEMNVDDVDILSDKDSALACNSLLKDYLTEEIALKESNKFKSYFGKFNIQGVLVEVMGEWQIKDEKGNWGLPFSASERQKIILDGQEIYVTTLESELSAFAKMGRWTAYQKILREMKEKQKNQQGLF